MNIELFFQALEKILSKKENVKIKFKVVKK